MGLLEGLSVGLLEGLSVGSLEGLPVGLLEGLSVGSLEVGLAVVGGEVALIARMGVRMASEVVPVSVSGVTAGLNGYGS